MVIKALSASQEIQQNKVNKMEPITINQHQEAKLPCFVISDPVKRAAAIFESDIVRRNKRWQLINELAQS